MLGKTLQLQIKSIRARITRDPLTATFFLLGLVHCVAQGFFQSFLYASDNEYSLLLSSIVNAAQVPPSNHTNLLGNSKDFQLEMCNFIPHSSSNCSLVFELLKDANGDPSRDPKVRGEILTKHLGGLPSNSFTIFNTSDSLNETQIQVDSVPLSNQCIGTLLYPHQHLQNSRREHITLLAVQIWLFGISILAMCYDSVPHVLALLGARTILTAWSIYEVWRTTFQQNIFQKIIENPGTPCSAVIFPKYFQIRMLYQIPDVVLNCTALAFAAYLSWALVRVFKEQSVKTIGPPKEVIGIYKYFLAVLVCLQLEAFTLMAWMGLWLDQINNSYITSITNHLGLYRAVFVWYTVMLGPWMLLGWWGIRLEKKITTAIFIAMAFLFTVFACIMFYSQVYRWTFYVWPFFGCFTVAALILLLATIPLSIVCWRNFNQGLAQYLYAEYVLASSNFTPEVFEHDIGKDIKPQKSEKVSLEDDLATYYYEDPFSSEFESDFKEIVPLVSYKYFWKPRH